MRVMCVQYDCTIKDLLYSLAKLVRFIRFLTLWPFLDMAAKASLMRDIGIDMRYFIVMHKIILWMWVKQKMILSYAGESGFSSLPWKCWSFFYWKGWNRSTHGGINIFVSMIFLIIICICCAYKMFVFFMLQILELPNHPYFIGAQFHPEFKSRPGKPSPLFLGTYLIHVHIICPSWL